MSFVRTLVLLGVAAALGAWLWLVEAPKSELEAKRTMLLDLDPAAVAKVRLAYPDGKQIVVEKVGDKWNMTAPVAYPAEPGVVENFLTTVKETKIGRRLAKGEAGALAGYGLEGDTGSQARLEVTMKDGKTLPPVILGIATPVGYDAFARREGEDDVLVIPLLLQSSARKNPEDLRVKSMFAGEAGPFSRVTIEKPGEKIEIERRGDAAWAMLSPVQDAADAETLRSMLDSLATVDAIGFFDGPAVDRAALGLDNTATRFTASRSDGTSVAFAIGKEAVEAPAGNYFERASDHQVVKVPDWVAKKFAPGISELRDKRLLPCQVDDVRSMKWTAGSESFAVSRKAPGEPWTITPAIDGQAVNQRIVDNVLNAVVLAHADSVAGDAGSDGELHAYGLDQPLAQLEVTGGSGVVCASVRAAAAPAITTEEDEDRSPPGARRPPPARTFYVKDDRRSAVMRASAHEFSRLSMKRAEIVDAAPAAGSASSPATPDGEAGSGH